MPALTALPSAPVTCPIPQLHQFLTDSHPTLAVVYQPTCLRGKKKIGPGLADGTQCQEQTWVARATHLRGIL